MTLPFLCGHLVSMHVVDTLHEAIYAATAWLHSRSLHVHSMLLFCDYSKHKTSAVKLIQAQYFHTKDSCNTISLVLSLLVLITPPEEQSLGHGHMPMHCLSA